MHFCLPKEEEAGRFPLCCSEKGGDTQHTYLSDTCQAVIGDVNRKVRCVCLSRDRSPEQQYFMKVHLPSLEVLTGRPLLSWQGRMINACVRFFFSCNVYLTLVTCSDSHRNSGATMEYI